ncbi:histidine kinase [Neosynechococcus sphagnicola sy1]|uniref:Histidine kinase n=1 Tax=Neosynechococcus sphagnicola sy1 TaxID=1497020 RepID=A0A098TJR8_9CYAN|nr:hypothetical protein [Neosynechococcus sphagnicola]KGF72546.1 histidine kinase [Neosynechococcus sphagnicola sy1]
MATPFHIVVENNPAIIFASRGGNPAKVLPILEPFLEKFWQERETSGEHADTPECLVAQIVVRFGFEICEDDFSNLRVGIHFNPSAEYLYYVGLDQAVSTWVPDVTYQQRPDAGLAHCHPLQKTEA